MKHILTSSATSLLLLLAPGIGVAADATGRLTKTDINNPTVGVVTTAADGSFTVVAGGNDTWSNEDSFTYLHEDKTGDFDVAVRILSLDVGDASQQDSAKASLMVRADLTAGSANVQINGLPDESKKTIESIYRPAKDAPTDDMPDRPTSNTRGETPYPDVWLRLKREGSRFTTLFSNNSNAWTVLSSVLTDTNEFPAALKVGISTVAHVSTSEDESLRVTATYADYRDVPTIPPTTVADEPAGDNSPGTYPNVTVTAANWKLAAPADGLTATGERFLYNTGTKNSIQVSVEGAGPIPWTAPGFNQGDMDVNIGPRDAVAGLSNTGPYGPDYNGSVTDPTAGPAQGWYPALEKGLVLASVRKHRAQWNDGAPAFHGFSWVTTEGSSRRGYSMLDGVFRNQDLYLSIGKLGERAEFLPDGASPAALREGNIDIATAWFPFEQGWIAGYFADATLQPAAWYRQATYGAGLGRLTAAKNSAAEILTWEDLPDGTKGGLATLKLPGVDSLKDGMVFATSNHEGNDNRGALVTASPKADGAGWVIAIRPDDEDLAPDSYAAPERSQFGFVYVPYTAARLVGGQVRGATGAKVQSAGEFTVSRLEAGRYAIEIPDKAGTNGMLLLQNAGYLASNPTLTDDAALAYEFIDGKFVVESRTVSASGAFDTFPLRDTDFYFAWVDFQQPLAPTAVVSGSEPTFEIQGPVTVTADDIAAREAGIAVSTKRAEALVVAIDNANTKGFNDPITGQPATAVLIGYFYNPQTLQPIGEPFPILGNTSGSLNRNVVAYNPVSDQYIVVTTGRPYSAGGRNLPLVAYVNNSTQSTRLAKTVVHDPEAEADYDDIGVAVSTKNGNTLVVAEYQFGDLDATQGEGAVGWMYDSAGSRLGTNLWTRLDVIQGEGDEDDPDVVYLPAKDAFFFFTNTDAPAETALKNRLVGFGIGTVPAASGELALGQVGQLDAQRLAGQPQGHPSAIESPFNGEVLVAFDYGNGQANGDVSFTGIGAAPGYPLTTARAQVPYSEGDGATPLAHRHPRVAADPSSGVFVVSHNRRESASGLSNAMVFALLDSQGQPLPGRPEGQYVLAEGVNNDAVPSDANYHDVVYDLTTDSFLVVYNENNARTRLARLKVTSNHLVSGGDVSLSVRRLAVGIEIAWPKSASPATLESATAVTGPWSAAAAATSEVGDQIVVTMPTTSSASFFRLRR
jgi:hypothetical protein